MMANIFNKIVILLMLISLTYNQDIFAQNPEYETDEEKNIFIDNAHSNEPESWQAWFGNNIESLIPGISESFNKVHNNTINMPVTILNNIINNTNEVKYSFGYSPQPSITASTATDNALYEQKMSGREFVNKIVTPSVNRSREALKDEVNRMNINLKLHSLYLSNEAITK